MYSRSAKINLDQPTVAIISGDKIISSSLIKSLRSKHCNVVAVADDKWVKELLIEVNEFENTKIVKSVGDIEEKIDYVIFSDLCERGGSEKSYSEKDKKQNLVDAIFLSEKFITKSLFVFSKIKTVYIYKFYKREIDKLLERDDIYAGVVHVATPISQNKSFEENALIHKVIYDYSREILDNRIPSKLFLTDANDLSEEIIRKLFSFGSYGVRSSIVTKPIKKDVLFDILLKTNPKLRRKNGTTKFVIQKTSDEKVLSFSSEKLFIVLVNRLPKKQGKSTGLISKKKIKGPRKGRGRLFTGAISLVLLFLLLPYILAFSSFIFLGIANKLFEQGFLDISRSIYGLSKQTLKVAEKQSNRATGLILLGPVYVPSSGFSRRLRLYSDISIEKINVTKDTVEMGKKFVAGDTFNVAAYSHSISLSLENIYANSGLLLTELDKDTNKFNFTDLLVNVDELNSSREKLLAFKVIVDNLSEVLGEDSKRTYLVLLQNEENIKPTGGEIESTALVQVEGGGLKENEIIDVNDARLQIKGVVSPPEVLREVFEVENWSIKDSNWDPDFVVSAQKAQWFIDKGIGVSVDGVIAINKESIITINNLAEILSREKGERGIIAEFAKLYKHLNTKDIQMYLHNASALRALSGLNWTGEIKQSECMDNCYSDLLGLVEAKSYGNGSSELIRSARLNVIFEEGLLKRELVLKITNNSDKVYGAYERSLTPNGVSFEPVIISTEAANIEIIPTLVNTAGRSEIGVFFELEPNESKIIKYAWESGLNLDFEKGGSYKLVLRKQSGVGELPIEVEIDLPEDIKVGPEDTPFLTNGDKLIYNTSLLQDELLQFFW